MNKNTKRRIKQLTAVALSVTMILPSFNGNVKKVQGKETEAEYILMSNNSTEIEKINDKLNKNEQNKELEEKNIAVCKMTEGEAKDLENKSDTLIVEKDINVSASSNKLEGYASKQEKYAWNIKSIKADEQNKQNNNVKVAIIDSGMDSTEPYEVKEHVNFVSENDAVNVRYEDGTGHGTSIAGIIAGNGERVKGINPKACIYSLKVLDDDNKTSISKIVEAIYWCIDNKINIINMSFGTNVNSEILHKAVRDAYNHNILMVAAAGNTGGKVQYPAAYNEVIAVGSTNSKNEISEFSNKGNEIEVVAPGENVESLGGFGGYTVVSGTSMSAPHVTGIASVLWGLDYNNNSRLIREVIDKSARTLKEDNSGYGIIDLEYAKEIYNRIKKEYTNNENNMDITVAPNNSKLKEYNTSDTVEGLWSGGNHQISLDKGYKMGELGSLEKKLDVSLIRKYIGTADKEFASCSMADIVALHGGYNYVANLRYLFNVARRVNSGKSVSTAINDTTYSDSSYTSGNGKKSAKDIVSSLNSAIKAIATAGSSNGDKCKCILALAFHLAGDMYAHESIVPKTSIELTSKKGNSLSKGTIVTENFFNLKQFTSASYKLMKDNINDVKRDETHIGYVKFSKIKNFMIDGYKEGKYYEDNINFYSSRFNRGTSWAIASMLNDMYFSDDYFSAWTLVPDEYVSGGYEMKMFKLYSLTLRTKLPLSSAEKKSLDKTSYEPK